jgi:hypothetical protein
MEVHVVPPNERKVLISEVLHESAIPVKSVLSRNQDDWDIIDWMKVLNEKLDLITQSLSQGKYTPTLTTSIKGLELTFVNISAGGMSFISKTPYRPDDILCVKMVLPETPPIALMIYAEVVSSKAVKTEFDVNVNFVHLGNEIRNYIATFVFNREREILRAGLE